MKRKIYIIGTTALIIIMSLALISLFTIANKPTKVSAADNKYTITVTKVTTISIYVTGEDVKLKSDSLSNSVYEVSGNKEFVLTCVNESRLFKSWIVQDENGNDIALENPNQSRIVLTTDKNLKVSTIRTDPTTKDLGKYMDNPFVLSSEANLLFLDNIFDYQIDNKSVNDYQLLTAYNHFFKNDPDYKATIIDAGIGNNPNLVMEEKIAYININGYFERLQKGYFKVEESFTVLNESFAGIGSKNLPFQGVVCGLNTANSSNAQIFLSINLTEKNGDLYCGLFEVIDENAVIRNLIVKNSIGISKAATNTTKYNIYAGGIAGELINSLLINLKISSTINIDATNKNIYAGGVAGKMQGGIDDISNLDLDFSNNTWSILASEKTKTYGGLIAGYAENVYVSEANINVSGYSINAKNVSSYNYDSSTNVYLGNLFGYYKNTVEKSLKNIKLYGKTSEYIHSIVSSGNNYVGGLIGYVETNATLLLGRATFEIDTNKTKIIAESLDGESRTNLYVAGIVAYVEGTKFTADDDFKNGIKKVDVDGKPVDEYQYIFNASMEITAKQEGIQSKDLTYGNTIAAGMVGEGYFNINGASDDERTNLLITSGNYSLSVSAIQTSMSSHEAVPSDGYIKKSGLNNNVRHCLSSLTFGYIAPGSDTTSYTYENINIYANNTNVEAYRSVGSTSLGDVNASGFLSYAKGRNIQNVTMYLGELTSIKANALSYEAGYESGESASESNNNVYVSAFVSHVIGISASTTSNKNIDNIKISGYNFDDKREVGTCVEILGIQNSKAINNNVGCGDYVNENYVGGVFGCIRGYFNISNIYYDGNPDVQSQIVMQGHRDPNTAFVGGIVGFVKLVRDDVASGANQIITNCTIKNAKVYGSATISNNASYDNPDIYAGGIVGASFADSVAGSAGILRINSARVIDTEITCIGNERIQVYAGGIVGTQTWSGAVYVTDAYVYNSKVTASLESVSTVTDKMGARASGIIPMFNSSTVTINYSAVINSEIIANCSDMITSGKANTGAAILYVNGSNTNNISATNCYTNSVVQATYGTATKTEATQHIYGNFSSNRLTNCYYVKDKNSTITSYGIAVELTNQVFEESEQRTILNFSSTNNADKSTKLFYKIFAENNFISNWSAGNTSDSIEITAEKDNATSEIEVWINAKQNGDNSSPYDYQSEEERINAGWFNIGNLYLISGKKISDPNELIFDEESFNRTYIVDGLEYRFNGVVDGKKEFVTIKEPYKYLYDIGYDEHEKSQIKYTTADNEELTIDCYTTDIYLRSILSSIKLNFVVKLKNPESNLMPPTYYDSWLKLTGTAFASTSVEKIDMSDSPLIGYGGYSYSYNVIEYDTENHYLMIDYELIYTPNKELTEDVTLYTAFYVGSTVNSTSRIFAGQCLRFNLHANKLILAGATLAEYTQPMNPIIDENLGTTIDNPYHFQVNSSYRIVPVLKRKNEKENSIISELYIQNVTYDLTSLNDGNVNDKAGILRSNGELITGSTEDSNTTYSAKITLKEDTSQEIIIYFVIVSKYNLSYTGDGANIEGLPFCTDSSDYYLDINVLSYCGGVPNSFVIKIGNNSYNLLEKTGEDTNYYEITNHKWIYDENGNQLSYWDNNMTSYQLRIPKEEINGNVSISMAFVVNFTIEFHIQTESFNPEFGLNRDLVLSVKVKSGTRFNDLFSRQILISDRDTHIGKTYKEVLDEWTSAANDSSFGYLFTGFYLIDDSSSVSSYGQSFDKILEQNLAISTSYVFYARWSFLIELVEAPGTHIVTSFNQDFLYEVKQSNYEGLLNKNVIIPINNNRGYVFTIVKDKNFIGEADVEAYVISGTKNNQIINQITIEKYHDNMYLYYIAPEEITGYLVISTKVSNSEIIVGENTASVNKDIFPEDGIYTFKYIVNHKKNESYIYNGKDGKNNLTLNRELLLQFFEERYDTTTGKTYLKPRTLTKNTIIEVYYNKYLNGSDKTAQTILGKYLVRDESITELRLTDFTNFNGVGSAFEEMTFKELLSDYESVSEVYYFVIIPPNGENNGYQYDDAQGMYGEYINNYLYLGYYDENSNEYISGLRSTNGFTNIPIEELLKNQLQYESSCQIRSCTTTPSRVTKLEKDNIDSSLFHFTDDKKFNVFDVLVENGELTSNNRIRFFDSSSNKETIIRSNIIKQGIYQLRLNFGYNKGIIKVSGSTDGIIWDQIEIFNVERELYKDYIVDFDPTIEYKYFKIEKLSDLELRLSKIGLVVISNGMLYELEFVESEFEEIYIPNYTIKNITLPIMQGLTWSVSDSPAATISNDVLVVTRQATEQMVTLKARYELEDQVKIKTYEVVIPSNNKGGTSSSQDFFEVELLKLPNKSGSTLILPNLEGLTWQVISGQATISDDIVTLIDESDMITLKATYSGISKEFTVYMQKNSLVYTLRQNIIGDLRHDNKRFIMAIQFKDESGNIVEDVKNVSLLINGVNYTPIIESGTNLNVLYFDLTDILEAINSSTMDIKVVKPDNYNIYVVQLLECSLHLKPAMGEVRASYVY